MLDIPPVITVAVLEYPHFWIYVSVNTETMLGGWIKGY